MKIFFSVIASLCLYMRAYAQNSREDYYKVGLQFLYGVSRNYDPLQAKKYLLLAAREGDTRALTELAGFYSEGIYKNVDSAICWYKNAISAKVENSYFLMGRYFQLGKGVNQDFTIAARYYTQGVKAGEKYSKNALAYLNFKGLGVKQDYAIAFQFFLESAQDSLPNSMYFLGVCYRNGYGTAPDQTKAKYWLKKAAAQGENAALHELMEEETPENLSVVSPEFQKQLKVLQASSEKYQADNNNNYEGTYDGVVIYYDWSGSYVTNILPLQLQLFKTTLGYNGTWKEGESESASITMKANNNMFTFMDGSTYVRKDHYSARKAEVWQFNNAGFQLSFANDTIQLTGNVQFYSPVRNEPGKPLQVILKRKMDMGIGIRPSKSNLQLFPNPAGNFTNVKFQISQTAVVGIQVYSQAGVMLYRETPRKLPAGTYNIPLPTEHLKSGTYVVQLVTDQETQSRILVKL